MPWKYKVRYARRMDGWPLPFVWVCGVPDSRHKYWIFAWLHAAWRRPGYWGVGRREEVERHEWLKSR
jgi:hypothetical protein